MEDPGPELIAVSRLSSSWPCDFRQFGSDAGGIVFAGLGRLVAEGLRGAGGVRGWLRCGVGLDGRLPAAGGFIAWGGGCFPWAGRMAVDGRPRVPRCAGAGPAPADDIQFLSPRGAFGRLRRSGPAPGVPWGSVPS